MAWAGAAVGWGRRHSPKCRADPKFSRFDSMIMRYRRRPLGFFAWSRPSSHRQLTSVECLVSCMTACNVPLVGRRTTKRTRGPSGSTWFIAACSRRRPRHGNRCKLIEATQTTFSRRRLSVIQTLTQTTRDARAAKVLMVPVDVVHAVWGTTRHGCGRR